MAWMKKSSGKSPGYHKYTNEDMKRVQWCLDKKIKIAVIPSGTKWQIELNINDKIHLDPEIREQKWQILSYIIDMNKMQSKDVAKLLQNNPWFNEWYCRMILSDKPVQETYH